MSHLPFILAAYGLTGLVMGVLGGGAFLRLGSAKRKLAAIDPRNRR